MAPDITAAELRRAFQPHPGVDAMVLPDGVLRGSSAMDLDRLRVALEASPGVTGRDDPFSAQRDPHEPVPVVVAPGVLVHFRCLPGEPITFDFDLREIVDDARLDALIALLRAVAVGVRKDVAVMPEGDLDGDPVLVVDAATGCVVLRPLEERSGTVTIARRSRAGSRRRRSM